MKNILILGGIIIVIMTGVLLFAKPAQTPTIPVINAPIPADQEVSNDDDITPKPAGKLKADTFTGTLTKVDLGCLADGECYVEVDGKKVTVLVGFSTAEVGSVIDVPSISDLEAYIGKPVEVYAQDNSDGTYTLYGSSGFYIKPL